MLGTFSAGLVPNALRDGSFSGGETPEAKVDARRESVNWMIDHLPEVISHGLRVTPEYQSNILLLNVSEDTYDRQGFLANYLRFLGSDGMLQLCTVGLSWLVFDKLLSKEWHLQELEEPTFTSFALALNGNGMVPFLAHHTDSYTVGPVGYGPVATDPLCCICVSRDDASQFLERSA